MGKRRVVVTGIGLVTPLGECTKSTWNALLAGKSSCVPFSPSSNSLDDGFRRPVVPYACSIQSFTPPHYSESLSKFIQYALSATEMALKDAGLELPQTNDCDTSKMGVSVGSGIGSIQSIVDSCLSAAKLNSYTRLSPHLIPNILTNMAAGHISIKYRLNGPNHSVSTACAAGAHSIGDAFRFIQYGDADLMIAGGTESSINPFSISAFAKARALSFRFSECPHKASRPFDVKRDGFVMGEGSGIIILEEYEHAINRNARIYAEVVGYGMSGDAHHITLPSPDNKGAIICMKNALKDAEIDPSDVGYINAHATSTKAGDISESHAISKVFSNGSLVSSTKGATGHLLGAAGAIEAAFCILALANKIIPGNLNLTQIDSEVADISLIREQFVKNLNLKYAFSNSFGFGGVNTSLIFKEHVFDSRY